MGKGRLEAFSDGVIAIIITIMVLELKQPETVSFQALLQAAPYFLIYALSFVFVGIYWNNHHHMFHAVRGVNGGILWANLHLLFWLSLVPFASAWMGQHLLASVPVAFYGFVLFMAGAAYTILARLLVAHDGRNSVVERAFARSHKEIGSTLGCAIAIGVAFLYPAASLVIYAIVALAWLIPDRRIERAMKAT